VKDGVAIGVKTVRQKRETMGTPIENWLEMGMDYSTGVKSLSTTKPVKNNYGPLVVIFRRISGTCVLSFIHVHEVILIYFFHQ
jgi:hypothetical protein